MKLLSRFFGVPAIEEKVNHPTPSMSKEVCNSLAIRYPLLKNYILKSYEDNRTQELYDFLQGIELEDPSKTISN